MLWTLSVYRISLAIALPISFHRVGINYPCPNLVNNVTASQISDFVWVSDADFKGRLRSLLYAHARLRLSLRSLHIGGWLYGRGSSETAAIFFQVDRIRQTSSTRGRRESGSWPTSKRFLLGRCWGFIGRCRARLGRHFSERTKGIKGVIDGFQLSRLRANLARAPWASSSRSANLGGADGQRGLGGSCKEARR